MAETLIAIINLLGTLLSLLILTRVVFSWIRPDPYNPIVKFVYDLTEPILTPVRRLLPQTGMFDFSPMITLLLIALLQPVLTTLVQSLF